LSGIGESSCAGIRTGTDTSAELRRRLPTKVSRAPTLVSICGADRLFQVPTEREEASSVPTGAEFLAAHRPQAHEHGRWDTLRFQLASYLCARLPPLELIGSARAVLLRAGQAGQGVQVMVVRDPGSVHVLPGGRRQAGESLEQTLRRELLEETGWAIHQPHLLGVRHFHHCRTPDGDPFPDFFQAVYVAHAHTVHPEAREVGGYELEAAFQPVADVRRLPLPPNERLFLDAALHWSGSIRGSR
jgi:ADP-ribose pyrophosphatase YjhB (NUDIX family)